MESPLLFYPILFVVGALLGSLTNLFVDRFCWTPRFRSPWRVWPKEFGDRLGIEKIGLDFVPIVGWLSLRRIAGRLGQRSETDRLPGLESPRFWIRPFFVELLSALGVVALFAWEVQWQMIRPDGVMLEPWNTVFLRFAVHVVFFQFLLAASLIDLDDMIIPDILTVPGTLLGLVLAVMLPQILLPATEVRTNVVLNDSGKIVDVRFSAASEVVPLNLCSPNPITAPWLDFSKTTPAAGLLIGGLWTFWCFAMLNRVWYFRLPFRKAAAIFCRYLKRSPSTKWLIGAAILGWIGVAGMMRFPWMFSESPFLLLTALVGMATGMAIIWGTRLIGSAVLGREAMGFGDVTLMGLIGVFVGWQSCILIFFMAPILGLILVLLGALLKTNGEGREFPFGPSLCLATFVLVVAWRPIWSGVPPHWIGAASIFELGWIIGLVMVVCLVLLGVLLGLWRAIKSRFVAD